MDVGEQKRVIIVEPEPVQPAPPPAKEAPEREPAVEPARDPVPAP